MIRPGIAFVVGCVAIGCHKAPPERVSTVPVRVATATKITAPVTIEANGIAEALQTVSVEAQIGGILTEVTFHEGDDVEAGQVLFRIDPRPLEATLRQAQASLARDAAQAQSAARDAERYRALADKDYVTKSQADQSAATAAALRASVLADSAAVESAQLNLAYATIRAPISGRTGSLLVRQGNLVRTGGSALVVINQIHPILVRFPVTQREFLSLARRVPAGELPVHATTADSVSMTESGVLTFTDNAVDSLTGTVTAKARFGNVSRKLWPGAFVRISVQLDAIPNAIAVPTPAIMAGQTGSYVYVIDASQQARVRPIAIGRAAGELTVIDSGLVAGERVVIDGQTRLTPGAKVEVQQGAGGGGRGAGTAEAPKK